MSQKINNIQNLDSQSNADNIDILRHIYDLKTLLGNENQEDNEQILALFSHFTILKNSLHNKENRLLDKLIKIDEFAEKLADSDFLEATDLYNLLMIELKELLNVPVSKTEAKESFEFLSKKGNNVPESTLKFVEHYYTLFDKLVLSNEDSVIDVIYDIVEALKTIPQLHNKSNLKSTVNETYDLIDEYEDFGEMDSYLLEDIKNSGMQLDVLTLSDLFTYKPVEPLKYSPNRLVSKKSTAIASSIENLKDIIANKTEVINSNLSISEDVIITKLADVVAKIDDNFSAAYSNDAQFLSYFDNILSKADDNYSKISESLISYQSNTISQINDIVTKMEVNRASLSENDAKILDQLNSILEKASQNYDSLTDKIIASQASLNENNDTIISKLSDIQQESITREKTIVDTVSEKLDDVHIELNNIVVDSHEELGSQIDAIKSEIVESINNASLNDELLAFKTQVQENNIELNQTLKQELKAVLDKMESQEESAIQYNSDLYNELRAVILHVDEARYVLGEETNKVLDGNSLIIDGITELVESIDSINAQISNDNKVSNQEIVTKIDAVLQKMEDNKFTLSQNDSTILSEINSVLTTLEETQNHLNNGNDDLKNQLSDLKDSIKHIKDNQASNSDTLSIIETNTIISEKIDNITKDFYDISQNLSSVENSKEVLNSIDTLKQELKVVIDEVQTNFTIENTVEIEKSNQKILSQIDSFKKEIISVLAKNAEDTDATVLPPVTQMPVLFDKVEEVKASTEHLHSFVESISSELANMRVKLDNSIVISKYDIDSNEEDDIIKNAEKASTLVYLDEINDKLNSVLYGVGGEGAKYMDNIQLLITDVADIRDKMTSGTQAPIENSRVLEELAVIRELLGDTSSNLPYPITTVVSEGSTNIVENDDFVMLLEDLQEIKNKLNSPIKDDGQSMSEMFKEIASLRNEITSYKNESNLFKIPEYNENDILEDINEEEKQSLINGLVNLRREILELNEKNNSQTEKIVSDLAYKVSKIAENPNNGVESLAKDFSVVSQDVASIKQVIAELKSDISNAQISVNLDNSVKKDFEDLKKSIQATLDKKEKQVDVLSVNNGLESKLDEESLNKLDGLNKEIEQIKFGIEKMLTEPDLTVAKEILVLREELQSLRQDLIGGAKSSSNYTNDLDIQTIVTEQINSLKDELNMLRSNDSSDIIIEDVKGLKTLIENDKTAVEIEEIKKSLQSNAVMAKELTAIRKSLDSKDSNTTVASEKSAIIDQNQIQEIVKSLDYSKEIKEIKDTLSQFNVVKEIEEIKKSINEINISKQVEELTKAILASNVEAQINDVKKVLDEVASTNITDELESLRKEIVSAKVQSQSTSLMLNEISKLKQELSTASGKDVKIENKVIFEELQKLKEELSKENATDENKMILAEISKLNDEMGELIEKDSKSKPKNKNSRQKQDRELSESINDLKTELNHIVDMVSETEDYVKTTPKRQEEVKQLKQEAKQRAKKSKQNEAKYSSTNDERANGERYSDMFSDEEEFNFNLSDKIKTITKPVVKEVTDTFEEEPVKIKPGKKLPEIEKNHVTKDNVEILDKIEKESETIKNSEKKDDLSLSLKTVEFTTVQEIDLATKLAKQVANKLIMEQLVVQLDGGGMPKDQVERIVKDILPTEFNTVQLDEQTDNVRQLANKMVLDKLRERLTGK